MVENEIKDSHPLENNIPDTFDDDIEEFDDDKFQDLAHPDLNMTHLLDMVKFRYGLDLNVRKDTAILTSIYHAIQNDFFTMESPERGTPLYSISTVSQKDPCYKNLPESRKLTLQY